MDTDQLTPMAYDSIGLAHDATDCLRSELGAICSDFRTEDDYLHGILDYVQEIEADPIEYLDSWDISEETDLGTFKHSLKLLREHIEETIATPLTQRGKPEW